MTEKSREAIKERLRTDTVFWAEHCAQIVNKDRKRVPLLANDGQLELDRGIEAQRAAGKPMRAIILKARQMGFSTWIQAKAIHMATQSENFDAVVVAHDKGTGQKLFKIGHTIYRHLPEEGWIKPAVGNYRTGLAMQFGENSREAFAGEAGWPNSSYWVDTAGEFAAGRGGTYSLVHGSEAAYWASLREKLSALQNAVPDTPETLIALESTANGFNEFRDLWMDAEEGRSEYLPIFWPWWKHPEYRIEFANEAEREAFVVGDGPYGEEESDLVANYGLEPQQLLWRRYAIANKCGGDIRIFDQEYPSSPAHAFLATGQKAFNPYRVATLRAACELTDPKVPTSDHPGPEKGKFEITKTKSVTGRTGDLIVPDGAKWIPHQSGPLNYDYWRLWRSTPGDNEYIIASDVSAGKMGEDDEPDWHGVQLLDHRTKEQVGEYRSRVDPDLLAEQILLAALYFNQAWIAVERTGGWGAPVLRKLWFDYQYPFTYRTKKRDKTQDKTEKRLGWDTNLRTKPELVSHMSERLREDDLAGIRSMKLVAEVEAYIRNEKGQFEASPGSFDDLLDAYMISQRIASETPFRQGRQEMSAGPGFRARTTLSSFDGR